MSRKLELVTIKKLSERTGLSIKAIQHMMHDGKLLENIHYYKKGGRIMLDYQAVMEWYLTDRPEV